MASALAKNIAIHVVGWEPDFTTNSASPTFRTYQGVLGRDSAISRTESSVGSKSTCRIAHDRRDDGPLAGGPIRPDRKRACGADWIATGFSGEVALLVYPFG